MEPIGIIGGLSWESTAEYLQQLNAGVRERLGGLHSAELRLASVDFAPIERMQANGDWAAAGRELAARARQLEAAGASCILIASNTMHKVYAEVAAAVRVPVLHLGDVTAEAIRSCGVDRIGLLATRYTMEDSFYRDRLAEHGINSVVPAEHDRAEVQRIIYDELCAGVVSDASGERLRAIASALIEQGAQGIVLGCTELELIVHQQDLEVPVFPTTTLHCTAALEWALGPRS